MAVTARQRIALVVACAAVLAAGCATAREPQLQRLSEKEAADLWSRARSYEPVGAPAIERIEGESEVTVLCAQVYALKMDTGKGGPIATTCGGSCKLKPGAKFSDCKTSGCLSSGRTCTPLVCEGGCTLSSACKATFVFGLMMP
jgi:hypothetical protein